MSRDDNGNMTITLTPQEDLEQGAEKQLHDLAARLADYLEQVSDVEELDKLATMRAPTAKDLQSPDFDLASFYGTELKQQESDNDSLEFTTDAQ